MIHLNGINGDENMFDILGIGFGPSNLALALCIREHNEHLKHGHPPLKSMFFERQASFHWHKDMLIDDATMQISYLKDLVTLRNPTSRFSFLNYLKQRGRLEDFINLKTFYPTRIEYADYLKWAAGQEASQVRYGHEVEEVRLAVAHPGGRHIEVVVRDKVTQEVNVHSTHNLVIGTGLQPKLPKGVVELPNVVHSSRFLSLLESIDPQRARRFLVVGGGQSAAEVVNHLHDRYLEADVVAVFPTFGYKPADDSNFVNQIFDPQKVDLFYEASHGMKSYLLERHADTNYSVVDMDLISELYRKVYDGKVKGRERLSMRRLSRLESLISVDGCVKARIRDLHANVVGEEAFDAVVLATGYHPPSLTEMVPAIAPYICRDRSGEVVLQRHYAVKTTSDIGGRIYLQGASERQHGLTSTLLSALPIRSHEIMQDILERRACRDTLSTVTRGVEHVA